MVLDRGLPLSKRVTLGYNVESIMTTLYSRKDNGASPEIDLVRDFEVLTHELTAEERTQFVNDVRQYINENRTHPENLRFTSAESLESKLSEITQSCDSWTGMLCYDPSYLEKIISRAEILESHLQTLRFEGGGLFYDLKNKDSSWYGILSSTASVDYFVFGDLQGLDSYLGELFDFFENTQSQDNVEMMFSRGAMYERTREFFDTDQVIQDGSEPMSSHVIDVESGLDLENVPYDLFEQATFTIGGDDMIFIASCVRDLEVQEQRQVVQRLVGVVEGMKISNEFERMNTLLALSELTADLIMMDQLNVLEMESLISQCAKTLTTMNGERKSLGLAKLNPAAFIDNVAMAIDQIARAGTVKGALPPNLGMLEAILKLSYLSADQIVLICNKITETGGDPMLEIPVVSGLSFEHIMDTFAALADARTLESRYHLQDTFDRYYVQHQNDKFMHHFAHAQSIIEGNDKLNDVTPEMVTTMITIESEGDKNKVSTTGVHFGLMQIGTEAYEQMTGDAVSASELRGLVTGAGWKTNIKVGTEYLQWCFDYKNPLGSLAVAIGNYNWSLTGMLNYRQFAMYGVPPKKSLNPETSGYILKYLAYQRKYHSNSHFQQNYLNA